MFKHFNLKTLLLQPVTLQLSSSSLLSALIVKDQVVLKLPAVCQLPTSKVPAVC